ncbi:MAG: sulfite exporter TauE/SafE family protein [Salinivirgaceae bacterium]|nr:sulfite exporter TauE/SafE family protein [Salinivirgaceae bacterium]
MTTTAIILLIVFCTGASFVQRVSGFGFGIFIMTMLPHLMPSYGEATTLSGMLSAAQSLYVLVAIYRLIDWKRVIPILLTFLVVSFFAVQYVSMASDTHLKHLLGLILLVMSAYFLIISDKIHLRPTIPIQLSMGTLSGVMGGLFAMQGPPAVLYFVASESDKERYLAQTQVYFFIGNVFMTVYRAQCGFCTPLVGWCWLYALVGVVIGSWIGKKVFDRIPSPALRKVIYAYMAVSGIVALMA